MKFKSAKQMCRDLANTMSKNSPVILTSAGVIAGIATVVLSIKATVVAVELMETEKCERIERDEPTEMTKKEILKVVWKPYVPVVATGVFSMTCVIGSCSVHSRRNAALAAAYKISETALTNFRDKTIDELGEKKVRDIQKKAASEKMERNPVSNSEVIIIGNGQTLCYDEMTDRYFQSDIETIRKAVNDCNDILKNEMYCSLNELYSRIGLPCTRLGNDLGWNIDQFPFEAFFDSKISDDGRPCVVMGFNVEPRMDYTNLH
nr:MAG TPA_asm: hypothetical protein [Caudoviricetes sp.]